jgi:hypothetical protein
LNVAWRVSYPVGLNVKLLEASVKDSVKVWIGLPAEAGSGVVNRSSDFFV